MKGIINICVYVIVAALAFTAIAIPTLGLSALAMIVLMLCTFLGASGRAAKAAGLTKTTLMSEEQIIAQGIQHRAFALFSRREVVAITNSRVLIVRRGLLGGFKMTDIQWKDLKDVRIEQNVMEGVCGSNLAFAHLNSGTGAMSVEGIASDVAATIYSKAQTEEQAWEEKRRVRAMEEVRAAAGGVVVHAPSPTSPPAAPTGNRMLAEITQAKALLDSGTISDAEFQEMKSKILAGS